jgi:hypothetical protein
LEISFRVTGESDPERLSVASAVTAKELLEGRAELLQKRLAAFRPESNLAAQAQRGNLAVGDGELGDLALELLGEIE